MAAVLEESSHAKLIDLLESSSDRNPPRALVIEAMKELAADLSVMREELEALRPSAEAGRRYSDLLTVAQSGGANPKFLELFGEFWAKVIFPIYRKPLSRDQMAGISREVLAATRAALPPTGAPAHDVVLQIYGICLFNRLLSYCR